jgi:glycosyltransferase involved in cell wall biosynthesis
MPSIGTSSEPRPGPSDLDRAAGAGTAPDAVTPLRRRHAMVVHAYYPVGETRVQRQAEALVDRGWEVDVICLRRPGEPARERQDGVRIRRLPVRRHPRHGMVVQLLEYLAFASAAMIALSGLQLRRRYTSVEVHNPPDLLVLCALVPKLLGIPVILDIHDLTPELFAARRGERGGGWLVRAVTRQERLACRLADHVITVTEVWRARLIERGVPPERISVTMNVADTRYFERAPARGPHDGERFRVVYHGTLTDRYGVDVLLGAVASLLPELPDLHLQVLGDGDARDALLRQAEELGLDGHVRFSPGMMDIEDVVREIQRADVGVVPNRRGRFTDELLPTKLLEYVAVGVPVLASRTPGLETYLDDGMVEYFTAGDAADLAANLRRLHDDDERRRGLVRKADDYHRRNGWPAVATAYTSRIHALATGRR